MGSSHLREIEFIFEQFSSNFIDKMKSVAVLTVLAMVFALLVLSSPQNSEASVIDDFMVSAEKATTFFQGADAAKTEAELALEAAEVAAKLPAEIEREATKPPQEVADEAAEAVAELKTEL